MANTRDVLGDQATLDALIANTLTDFEDDGVYTVALYAFYNKSALTSVKLPNLTLIQNHCFDNCTGLTQIPATSFPLVTNVQESAFSNCTGITSIVLPAVATLHRSCFNYCTALETLDFSSTTQKITVATNTNESNATTITALKNVIIRYTGSGISDLWNLIAAGPNLRKYKGAIFVPDSKVSEYEAVDKYVTILPLTRYPTNDYSNITDSWADIKTAETNGTYTTKYKIGDTKSLIIDGTTYYAKIVAFDEDDKADSTGKASITWLLTEAFGTRKMCDTAATNANDWSNSDLRTYLNETVFPSMSNKDYIVSVTKTFTTYVSGSKDLDSCTDSIWVPSVREMNNSNANAESSGASYYSDWLQTYITTLSISGFWTRTKAVKGSNFYLCYNTTSFNHYSATSNYNILIGFCT